MGDLRELKNKRDRLLLEAQALLEQASATNRQIHNVESRAADEDEDDEEFESSDEDFEDSWEDSGC